MEVHYQRVYFYDKKYGYLWFDLTDITVPSVCSKRSRGNVWGRTEPPYALWYDADRDIYRVNSAGSPTSMDPVDFRRIPRPGHVFENPSLRLLNTLALLLGMASLGVGWRRGSRWLVAAILFAGLAALLSRWG